MKVPIPKEIKCGAHVYKVFYDTDILLDRHNVGMAYHDDHLIGIESRLKETTKDQCFLHELLEVIKRIYGVHMEHEDIDRVAEGFLDILRNGFHIEFDWSEIKEDK